MAATITAPLTSESLFYKRLERDIKIISKFRTNNEVEYGVDIKSTLMKSTAHSLELCMILQIALGLAIKDNFKRFREAV